MTSQKEDVFTLSSDLIFEFTIMAVHSVPREPRTEEIVPMTNTDEVEEVEDNKTNLANVNDMKGDIKVSVPELGSDNNDNPTDRISCSFCNYKVCCFFVSAILFIVSIVLINLLVIDSPLLHKQGNSTTNCSPLANSYQLLEDPLLPNPTVPETNPGILLFLDEKPLKNHKRQAYNVAWKLGPQGFKHGNISFNGSTVYIKESGAYMISISLQMEIKESDKGTLCNLVLNSRNHQYAIHHKYDVPKDVSLTYRFIMSLKLVQKLKEGQEIYISVSPRDYLSDEENSSFLSMYMIKHSLT